MAEIVSRLQTAQPALRARVKVGPRSRREIAWFYVFISPWLVGFLFLTLVPMVMGFGLSLSNFNGLNWATMKFVGAANYLHALTDSQLWSSLRLTLLFTVVSVPLGLVVSMGLALLVNWAWPIVCLPVVLVVMKPF